MQPISLVELSQLAIVGAFVAVVIQYFKANFASSPGGLRLAVIGLSLVTGTAYYLLQGTAFWTAFVTILALANTVFLFVIKPLEDAGKISGAK